MADESGPSRNSVPVTVLTGFLGSGKTTLLNYILHEQHGKRIAVIENEFGEVGVDDALVINAEEEVFEMNNGCICCTVRGDLIRILGTLAKRRDKFDYVLIETTGLADPGPVAQTFFVDSEIRTQFHLDAIVTVVDSKHLLIHLEEEKPEGVENEALEQIAFADRIILNKTDLVSEEELANIRTKVRLVNAVASIFTTEFCKIDLSNIFNVGAFKLSRIIEMDPEFLEEAEHQHDLSVKSVGIEMPGAVNQSKLNEWLRGILMKKGNDIFRMKGVLNIKGQDEMMVFQGVHMLFDSKPGRKWGTTERKNRMIFIGRNLEREEIFQSFKACVEA